MAILYVGIDLAKSVFSVRGVNDARLGDLLGKVCAIKRAARCEMTL